MPPRRRGSLRQHPPLRSGPSGASPIVPGLKDRHRGRGGRGLETQTGEETWLRVFVGRDVEIGAAWSKRSEEGRDYLSLKLDDPSFTAPIYANLFNDEGGEGFNLLWSRPRKNGE